MSSKRRVNKVHLSGIPPALHAEKMNDDAEWRKACEQMDAAFQARLKKKMGLTPHVQTKPGTKRPLPLMPAYSVRQREGWTMPPSEPLLE